MINGINIDSIRELNKVKLYAYNVGTPKTGGAVSEVKNSTSDFFSAYLTQPLGGFDAGVQVNSLMNEFAGWINKAPFIGKMLSGTVSSVIQRQTDTSLAFNYDYNYQFTGTPQFTKTLSCELVTKNDFYEDVAKPLYRLLEWLVPDEGQKLADTTSLKDLGAKIMDDKNPLFQREWMNDIARFLWETANEYFGGITFYKIPKQFEHEARLRVCIGEWIVIENVIIDSVKFDIPWLLYEDGLFDKIGLSLSLKGTRNTSIHTYDWVKNIAERNYAGRQSVINNAKSSLNAAFKPTTK